MARYTISIDTRIETLLNNYMKENNVKFSSNQRTEFFRKAQDIEYTKKKELKTILDNLA